MITISDSKLRQIISESISEMLNTSNRDTHAWYDGKYRYQGTGSEESRKRVEKLRYDNKFRDKDAEFRDHGGDYPQEKRRKEYGKFKSVSDKNGDNEIGNNYWHLFINHLRDLASKNYTNAPFSVSDVECDAKKLATKEGAASFIKYLYTNGFDPESK